METLSQKFIRTMKEYEENSKLEESKKNLNERLIAGNHPMDDMLDGFTIEELYDTIYSNIPEEKLNDKTAMKEFEDLIKYRLEDARHMAKRVVPEIVKMIYERRKKDNKR